MSDNLGDYKIFETAICCVVCKSPIDVRYHLHFPRRDGSSKPPYLVTDSVYCSSCGIKYDFLPGLPDVSIEDLLKKKV